MTRTLLLSAALATALAAAGCATGDGLGADPTIPEGATSATRTESNGDRITEYRVDGRVRAVMVQPSRGPTYYLYDRDGDGIVDENDKGAPQTYFKLFEWN